MLIGYSIDDDNARPYQARMGRENLDEVQIKLEWPPIPPDMNPIKRDRDRVKSAV